MDVVVGKNSWRDDDKRDDERIRLNTQSSLCHASICSKDCSTGRNCFCMNAVIDEDLHRSLAGTLEAFGFKVIDIRDYGLRGKSDDEVYTFAQRHKAVLFSGDLDFSSVLRFKLGSHYGICILRFPNELSTDRINSQVKVLLKKLEPEDYRGNLIILSPGKLRIRREN